MGKPRGAWSGSPQAKPASDYQIRYGHGLLEHESANWPAYAVVTTPSAFAAASPHLASEPLSVSYARWLDWGHLEELANNWPDGTALVVGVGGGTALDAAKYVALKHQVPVILVPTVVSTGAVIHGMFAKWEGRNLIGPGEKWPWIDIDDIIVDYDVVLMAPPHLNTAGLGDVLCSYAGVAEWQRNSRLGIGSPFDPAAVSVAVEHHRQIVAEFPSTLSADRFLTSESVLFIMTAVQERDSKCVENPAAPAGDHMFWPGMELANGKGWVHGEGVALGAVIIAWHCDERPETLIASLDRCMVSWRPNEMGLTRAELERGLEFAPTFMADVANGRDLNSILRTEPLTGARFDDLWSFLQRA